MAVFSLDYFGLSGVVEAFRWPALAFHGELGRYDKHA